MATGDMANNVAKLQAALKKVGYKETLDKEGLSQGRPEVYLPIYHHVFMTFSRAVAQRISDSNIEMYGKTDQGFVDAAYKTMRELFSYKPPVTKDKFFTLGFAECKVIMCTEVVTKTFRLHQSLEGTRPASATSRVRREHPHGHSRPSTAQSDRHSQRPVSTDSASVLPIAPRVVNEKRQTSYASTSAGSSGAAEVPVRQPMSSRNPSRSPLSSSDSAAQPSKEKYEERDSPGKEGMASGAALNSHHPLADIQNGLVDLTTKTGTRLNELQEKMAAMEVQQAMQALTIKRLEDAAEIKNKEIEARLSTLENKMAAQESGRKESQEPSAAMSAVERDQIMARLILLETRLHRLENASSNKPDE